MNVPEIPQLPLHQSSQSLRNGQGLCMGEKDEASGPDTWWSGKEGGGQK